MTREEKVTALLVTLVSLPGLAYGYRQIRLWQDLWFLGSVFVVIIVILFAAGVQLRTAMRPWRPRMLLMLIAVLTLPLPIAVGAKLNDLDFKFRRKAKYEALIAAIKPSLVARDDEAFQVSVPANAANAVSIWARRQTDGQLVLEFPWSRREYYVYCDGHGCERDKVWRSTRRLDEHWFIGYR